MGKASNALDPADLALASGVEVVDLGPPMGRVARALRGFDEGERLLSEGPALIYRANGGEGLLAAFTEAPPDAQVLMHAQTMIYGV